MSQKLIDTNEFKREMFHKCIETDEEIEKGRAKWESGLWIRYKVFEDTIEQMTSAQPEITFEQIEEYCHKMNLSIISNDLLYQLTHVMRLKGDNTAHD